MRNSICALQNCEPRNRCALCYGRLDASENEQPEKYNAVCLCVVQTQSGESGLIK